MLDRKLIHNATLVTVVHALHFIAESCDCVTRTALVNCFHKFGFNLNEINHVENATELNVTKYDWG